METPWLCWWALLGTADGLGVRRTQSGGQGDRSVSEELRLDKDISVVALFLPVFWQQRAEKPNEQPHKPLPICDMVLREKI